MPERKWSEANQGYLAEAAAEVRMLLEQAAAAVHGKRVPAKTKSRRRTGKLDDQPLHPPPALETLCTAFGLSPYERKVLLLCAGMELDAATAPLCASLNGNAQHGQPTWSLALSVFPDAHWSALGPLAPLRRWRLIEMASGETLLQSPLRIDESVLHYLTGVDYQDGRLHGVGPPLQTKGELPPSHENLAARFAKLWKGAAGEVPVIHLCGPDQGSRRALAATACARLGLEVRPIHAADLPTATGELETIRQLWEREALLRGRALLLDCDLPGAQEGVEAQLPVGSFIERLQGRLILSSKDPFQTRGRQLIRLDVVRPTSGEQLGLWQKALGPIASELNGHLETLTHQFDLGPAEIQESALQVREDAATGQLAVVRSRLWESCLARARPHMGALAARIEPAASWEDLVLPPPQCRTLRDISAQVRHRALVYERWGFAAKSSRGLGISALFTGVSGTGKTLAAEVLAAELELDLYRIDLSSVVSKYIGETEKNLRRVFEAAEGGGAILLFDEADALFGKRSEVKDSHDRYANIQVSYLLQRMETYRGLSILTTNMKSALDSAFLRRIRFVVDFPFPNYDQRAEIWRRVFPNETPVAGLDVAKLAKLNVAGGSIRNIALNAAFHAAEQSTPVRMNHLMQAVQREFEKLEKPLTETVNSEPGRT